MYCTKVHLAMCRVCEYTHDFFDYLCCTRYVQGDTKSHVLLKMCTWRCVGCANIHTILKLFVFYQGCVGRQGVMYCTKVHLAMCRVCEYTHDFSDYLCCSRYVQGDTKSHVWLTKCTWQGVGYQKVICVPLGVVGCQTNMCVVLGMCRETQSLMCCSKKCSWRCVGCANMNTILKRQSTVPGTDVCRVLKIHVCSTRCESLQRGKSSRICKSTLDGCFQGVFAYLTVYKRSLKIYIYIYVKTPYTHLCVSEACACRRRCVF